MSSLVFDARLYTRKAVEKAVADYAQAAELDLSEKEGALSVEIKSIKEGVDPEEFKGEFSNYVLGVMGA